MSKRGAPVNFASKSMFDVLATDDVGDVKDDEDEVHDEPAESPSEQTPAEPMSKAARKRAARLAKKASESAAPAVNAAKDSADAVVGAAQDAAGDVADKADGSAAPVADKAGQVAEAGRASAAQAVEAAKEVAPQVVDKAQEVAQSAAQSTSAAVSQAVESASAAATTVASKAKETLDTVMQAEPVRKANGEAKANGAAPAADTVAKAAATVKSVVNGTLDKLPSVSAPAASAFAPSLPSSLPQPTANALPANRKRKTPNDFSPSGPNDVQGQAAASKLGVKFEDGVAPGEGKDGETTIAKPAEKKNANLIERTTWTFIMIGGFIRHPYMILLVMLCQTLVYKEVTALFELRDNGSQKITPAPGEKGDSWSKTLNWYFFVVTNYFLYGESIIYYFKHIVFVDAYFLPFAKNHRFISFMLYVVGFVGFVANLQRQYLRQQFALFCWVHITLLLIVVSSHFIVNNILEGLIWFFVPASLVICNDVMAYVCGKLFGRTPLIKLSPKKTVEGFVGAFICTLVFGLLWGTFFMRFPYMICPARDLGMNVFSNITCKPNPVFVWREFVITGAAGQMLKALLGREPPAIPYAPFQIHVLVMATFASLVAPFGGFFASGFKRAFNIKDFGHSIPGHGGMTDRMDCQFMMGLFSYVYYSSLIRYVTVGSIMQTIVTSLSTAEQLELYADVRRFLDGQGVKVK